MTLRLGDVEAREKRSLLFDGARNVRLTDPQQIEARNQINTTHFSYLRTRGDWGLVEKKLILGLTTSENCRKQSGGRFTHQARGGKSASVGGDRVKTIRSLEPVDSVPFLWVVTGHVSEQAGIHKMRTDSLGLVHDPPGHATEYLI